MGNEVGAPLVGDGIGVRLEELVPGVLVSGVIGAGPVEVVSVRWHGGNALVLSYTTATGDPGHAVLRRDKESQLTLGIPGQTRAFDGDAAEWQLAAEALRIKHAALYDQMLAVATSEVQPLPHQIQAVYGELLPRTPLRFLLADDPGAGKTIMCGLYIKELMLRGDLARCLIVAPGSLVEQWQDEMFNKFGLRFEVLTRALIDSAVDGEVFEHHPLLIARMDQLSRNEDLLGDLGRSEWDLVVVDEAHRMSATYFGGELSTTKRYQLGRMLGGITRHLLLMTATPHAGKQEDFQLFLALLDEDRFEGRFRDGVHTVQPGDLMRRMVKEDLLTMEGKPLFPERRAYTVDYALSPAEQDLYTAVSEYVRDEMNRADRLAAAGEGRRGSTVGFALTVLQRRLASSPEAILRSLERRQARLQKRLREMTAASSMEDPSLRKHLGLLVGKTGDDLADQLEELLPDELESVEDEVVDAATAARTAAELAVEIAILTDLVELARLVRRSGLDKKWLELKAILTEDDLTRDEHGNLRKIIIFTEHKDTLTYLLERIRALLGRPEAVVFIHGGVHREERRRTQELFTQDNDVRVLVATDAAGEGINLQRAHLMVNYDLPWNPNRLEQRFGRIHRIGQTEVCHLWNLVARDTREGAVFLKLLNKIEQQRRAYQGKVFDVLGEAFADHSLRGLLVDAIRYGDRPETRARLDTVIDATVGAGLDALLAERALHRDNGPGFELETVRRSLEQAQAQRLQPQHVQAFFLAAFKAFGGRITPKEPGRYEITQVPGDLRDRDRQARSATPVLAKYDRVAFDPTSVKVSGQPAAQLIAPGHPLLDALVDLVIERHQRVLKHGSVLMDPRDQGDSPRLLVALTHTITDGHSPPGVVSKRFQFVELTRDGEARTAGPAPYLDYRPLSEGDLALVAAVSQEPWLASGAEQPAMTWAITQAVPEHEEQVAARVTATVERTRCAVQERLTQEISYWDQQAADLRQQEQAGKTVKLRPETATKRARELAVRLQKRLAQLTADGQLVALPPVIEGAALIIPQGLLDQRAGRGLPR